MEPAEKGKDVSSKAFLSNLKMVAYFSCLMCSPTLCLSDLELKVTQDLGTAGRSRAMTEGINDAMKALEIA